MGVLWTQGRGWPERAQVGRDDAEPIGQAFGQRLKEAPRDQVAVHQQQRLTLFGTRNPAMRSYARRIHRHGLHQW